jgi:hypothetical protein
MSNKHILKLTHKEAVVKLYGENETIDIDLQTDLKLSDETVAGQTQTVHIQAIYWACKNSQDAIVSRWDGSTAEGETYLSGTGTFEYAGFTDNTYATRDIRAVLGNGATVILVLKKVSGYTKDDQNLGVNTEVPNPEGN